MSHTLGRRRGGPRTGGLRTQVAKAKKHARARMSRFIFDDEALEIKIYNKESENVVVGGLNRCADRSAHVEMRLAAGNHAAGGWAALAGQAPPPP